MCMTRLSKFVFSILIVVLAACHGKPYKPLPYYLSPDLTPVWVSENSDSFKNIHQIPDFSFLNQNGKVITQYHLRGKIHVANFIFTSCTSICPKMVNNFLDLQKTFDEDKEVMLISYTVNPEVDSVGTLNRYAKIKNIDNSKWWLLTGNKTALYTLAKKEYFAGDSIGYYGDLNEFLHTEKVFLVDKHSRIRGVYNGTLPVEMDRIKEDIATLEMEE